MRGHRFSSRSGANRRYLISPPCSGPAWLGLVTFVPHVGQICRRENLDRTDTQVIIWILKLLKDRSIGFPVTVENVVENSCQLVDLTWNRSVANVDIDRFAVFHFGCRYFFLVIISLISIVRRCLKILPRGVLLMYFRDFEVTTPVVGKLGCVRPAVDVSMIVSSHMTNNTIEEKIRLAVSLVSAGIDFRNHEAICPAGMGGSHDLLENVSMKDSMLLLDLSL